MFGKDKTAIKNVWFLPRTRDNPREGALQLGDIIFSPDEPDHAINAAERVKVPSELIKSYTDPDSKWERKDSKSRGGGISAAYLQAAGISFSLDLDSSLKQSYEAERLETFRFSPNRAYIEACFKDGDAKIELAGPNAKKCLYMVTGLKLAYGATKMVEELHKRGIYMQVGVDSALAGFPGINIGPKGHASREVEVKGSSGKRNFVFAFQLRKLTWNKKQQTVLHEAFTSGAMYEDTEPEVEEEEEISVAVDDIDVQEVGDQDEFKDLEAHTFADEDEDTFLALVI